MQVNIRTDFVCVCVCVCVCACVLVLFGIELLLVSVPFSIQVVFFLYVHTYVPAYVFAYVRTFNVLIMYVCSAEVHDHLIVKP